MYCMNEIYRIFIIYTEIENIITYFPAIRPFSSDCITHQVFPLDVERVVSQTNIIICKKSIYKE